jgi:hypothetical protein
MGALSQPSTDTTGATGGVPRTAAAPVAALSHPQMARAARSQEGRSAREGDPSAPLRVLARVLRSPGRRQPRSACFPLLPRSPS